MKPFNYRRIKLLLLLLGIFIGRAAAADNEPLTVEIRFHDHKFDPAAITVPAGKPFELKVINDGPKAIEFESFKLHLEHVIGPGRTAIIKVRALKNGIYDFVDDFDDSVPEGKIEVQ